jgi:hypothetical protein
MSRGNGTEYRGQGQSLSAHNFLVTVAIILAMGVLVGMVLRGDPGPALGMDEWNAPNAPPAR